MRVTLSILLVLASMSIFGLGAFFASVPQSLEF